MGGGIGGGRPGEIVPEWGTQLGDWVRVSQTRRGKESATERREFGTYILYSTFTTRVCHVT